MAFKKIFNCATFENAKKYHMSYSQLCEKYGLSDEELEQAIRNVFHQKKADEMIRIFREQDEKTRKPKAKKIQSHNSEPISPKASKTAVVSEPEIAHMGIIEVDEITDDNVGDIVAAIDAVMADKPKSKLELLQEKEHSLSESLSIAQSELDKLCGIKADISQKLLSLTNEIRNLKNTIEQKISEVGGLRDNSTEVNNQIAVAELDVEALKKELIETQASIKIEMPVTITVLVDGWFKFDPEFIEIPKVEVSAEELSIAAAEFAGDTHFENLTIKNIRQFLLLDKMYKALNAEHPNINLVFNDENLGFAWTNWKGESI